jgi:hypothetical protein
MATVPFMDNACGAEAVEATAVRRHVPDADRYGAALLS